MESEKQIERRSDYRPRGYTKAELEDMYLNQNLTVPAIADKYSISKYLVYDDLKTYQIHKSRESLNKNLCKHIDEEELYNYYIIQNHSIQECSKYFHVGAKLISDFCHKYGYIKTKDFLDQQKRKEISYDDVYQYYIVDNHSQKEAAQYFGMASRTFRRKLRELGISKALDLQQECSVRVQNERYGALFTQSDYYKNSVVESMVEHGRETCLQRYGVTTWMQTEAGAKARRVKYRYTDIGFDSSWELALFIYAKDHNEPIEREPVKLQYLCDGEIHYYIPDFRYKDTLVEIKGDHLIKDGVLNNVYRNNAYLDAAKQACIECNHVNILQYADIKFAIDYVKEHYGKQYLSSFRI